MHITGLVDLAHRRINDGITGTALAPGREQGFIVGPLNGIVSRLECARHHMRMMVQDHEIEIPPHQLRQPGCGAFAGLPANTGPGRARECPYRNRAKAQMDRQIGWAFFCGKVPAVAIARHARQKIVQQFFPCCRTAADAQCLQIGRLKADVGKGKHALMRRCFCEMRGTTLDGIGLYKKRLQFFQPSIFVWRKYRERRAPEGQHLIFFKDHLVLAGQEGDT